MNKRTFLKKKGFKFKTVKRSSGYSFEIVVTNNKDCDACPYVLANKYGQNCCAVSQIYEESKGCMFTPED